VAPAEALITQPYSSRRFHRVSLGVILPSRSRPITLALETTPASASAFQLGLTATVILRKPMATQRQIEANRLNSQKSTGFSFMGGSPVGRIKARNPGQIIVSRGPLALC
jgi:hypothetical protein